MSLHNLVKDIYLTVDKGVEVEKLEGALQESLPSLKEVLLRRLSPSSKDKQPLRMSSIGDKCNRKLWYRYHTPDAAEDLAPHTRIKFLYGDIVEWMMLLLVSLTGRKIEHQQRELDVGGVKGHIDGVVDGTLIDVKSANSRGFDKFKKHDVPNQDAFNYMSQLGMYHHSIKEDIPNKDTAAFLAFDKEMGHVVVDEYKMDAKDWDGLVERKKKIVYSDELPPRGHSDEPHQSGGNRQLALACRYCEYKRSCYGDELKAYLYSSGPVYLTKVVKEPNVQRLY